MLTQEQWQTVVEIMGYCSSVLVLISLTMSSIVKLRIINTIGSAIFVVYALIVGSYPSAFMNLGIIFINLYFLNRLGKQKANFSMLETGLTRAYFRKFMDFYQDDIHKYFPEFDAEKLDGDLDVGYFIHCDMATCGVVLGRVPEEGVLELVLDYSTPEYRDFSVGKYLYDELKKMGYRKVIYTGNQKNHLKYVRKMGFVQEGDRYIKTL